MLSEDAAAWRTLRALYDRDDGRSGASDLVPAADVLHARAAGYVFDPVQLSHNELVAIARALAHVVDIHPVAQTFLASLTMKRPDLRAALPARVLLGRLPAHDYSPHDGRVPYCAVCGYLPGDLIDRSEMQLDRLRNGGGDDDLVYAWFSLDRYTVEGGAIPTTADVDMFRACLETLESLPAVATVAQAAGALKVVAGNVYDRRALLDSLGICGILRTRDHDGYLDSWVRWDDRPVPNKRFVENTYPASWWTAADGVGWPRVRFIFDAFV